MRCLALALLLVSGANLENARADSEQALSVGAGFATFSAPGQPMPGGKEPEAVSPTGGGFLHGTYERAIGTDLVLRAEGALGGFFGGNAEGQSSFSHVLLGDVGAAFRFDITRYIPYAFAGVGGVTAGGGPIGSGNAFVLVVGGGLDWLRNRKQSLGGEFRVASFGGDVTVVTIGFRATTRWGFF